MTGRLLTGLLLLLTGITANAGGERHRMEDSICASDFALPMRHEPLLSASFGELRENHFHSGLDFKTEGTVGKEVYPAADGWVSRIGISAAGYGKALYIGHPNGYTTVYGHLKDFSPRLDSVVKAAQYRQESYTVQLFFSPGELPVRREEVVAFSGNTGGSGGPHLHFEVRDTRTEEPVDPLLWFADRIYDNVCPRIRQVAVYAKPGQGVLSTLQTAGDREPVPSSRTRVVCTDTASFPAVWGRIGLSFKSYDYMPDQANTYGIAEASLYIDGALVYRREMNRLSFDEMRYINAATDYGEWACNRSWLVKTFRLPGNRLDVYPVRSNDGYIDITEERLYHVRFEVADRCGNRTARTFRLRGCRMPVPARDTSVVFLCPGQYERVGGGDFEALIDRDALYDTIPLQMGRQAPLTGIGSGPGAHPLYSDRYSLLDDAVPCHTRVHLKLKIQKDILAAKDKYFVARLDRRSGFVCEGGTYADGYMEATVRDFGQYAVMADTVAPNIYLPNVDNAMKNAFLRIRLSDDASGVSGYSVWIDRRWVLFEDDYKNRSIFYRPDVRRFPPTGREHTLTVKVWDACRNVRTVERTFIY